jgi:ribosomal protein S18 acetylase RimI-like enzyme
MIELKPYNESEYSAIKDYFPKKEIDKYTNRGGYRILSLFALYKSQYYLLWEDDNVVGCGVIRWKFSREFKQFGWWLYAIWIHPQSRGTGKGVILMNKLIEELSRKRIKRVRLNVDADNFVAQSLYKKIGFKVINQIKSQIYMQYDL